MLNLVDASIYLIHRDNYSEEKRKLMDLKYRRYISENTVGTVWRHMRICNVPIDFVITLYNNENYLRLDMNFAYFLGERDIDINKFRKHAKAHEKSAEEIGCDILYDNFFEMVTALNLLYIKQLSMVDGVKAISEPIYNMFKLFRNIVDDTRKDDSECQII